MVSVQGKGSDITHRNCFFDEVIIIRKHIRIDRPMGVVDGNHHRARWWGWRIPQTIGHKLSQRDHGVPVLLQIRSSAKSNPVRVLTAGTIEKGETFELLYTNTASSLDPLMRTASKGLAEECYFFRRKHVPSDKPLAHFLQDRHANCERNEEQPNFDANRRRP